MRASVRPIVLGYVLAAFLAAPFVAYVIIGLRPGGFGPARIGVDLLNVVLPTSITGIGGSSITSVSNRFAATGGYLGIPSLVIVAAYAWRARASRTARLPVVLFVLAVVVELGKTLVVAGHKSFPLPWRLLADLPLLTDTFPWRFAVFTALAAAVIVAIWTARTPGRIYARPFVLPVLAAAAIVPSVWSSAFRELAFWHPPRPAFFAADEYKTCIPRGETVTIFPFGQYGDSLLYQAESHFWFRMASDWLQPLPTPGKKAWASFDDDWVVRQLNGSGEPTPATLLAFAGIHGIGRYLSLARSEYPDARVLRGVARARAVGGVLVSPACGQPPLQKRNLAPYVQALGRQVASGANVGYCLGSSFVEVPQPLLPSGGAAGATRARYVQGQGLTCAAPPAGYVRRGLAGSDLGVPAGTYPLYVRGTNSG
ncbi:MAG: hypothetical protein JO064_10905 [Actinobacteria bacterium]|nr:hypothetical protein [Actinomycetota bacterium]